MELGELVQKLILDTSDYNKNIDDALSKGGQLNKGLTTLGNMTLAGLAAGTVAVGVGLTKSVEAAAEAEDIQSQLNAVLESTNGIAGVTADHVNNLASNLGVLTKFEDDAIVAGENLILTFTNIGADGGIFDQTTTMMLDMSQALGQDMKSSATQLGKALNDPINGISALSRVGVAFTDEQKEMIKTLQESGDMVGAQQIILNELKTEFGGSAEAAGKTFAGSLEIAKNSVGNIFESIGMKLLPALTETIQKITEFVNRPEIQAGIENIATSIGDFAEKIVEKLPSVIDALAKLPTWLEENQPIIIGVVGVLAIAVATALYSIATAAWAAISPLLPVIAVIAAIAVGVALLYKAWDSNFLGIQDTTKKIWAKLQPVFETVKAWLGQKIPVVLQFFSNLWTNKVYPSIQKVWNFLNAHVFPLFKAIAGFIGAGWRLQFQGMVDLFNTKLLPVFKAVWNFLSTYFWPVLKNIADWVSTTLSPVFSGFVNIIDKVTGGINGATSALNNYNKTPVSTKTVSTPTSTNSYSYSAPAAKSVVQVDIDYQKFAAAAAQYGNLH